jgi:hypothetical protein
MNINSFKEGDEITRVEPMVYKSSPVGVFGTTQEHKDGSFIGKKFKFVGIANGQIVLLNIENRDVVRLDVFRSDEGWEKYDPSCDDKATEMLKSL